MKKDLEYCKRQYQLSTLRAQWWMASVTSGHYKQRKVRHGTLTSVGTEYTDDEKLASAMATALRHIELAAEFSESLAADDPEMEKLP